MFSKPDPCSETLPDSAREAIALFNAGEFYRQHDLLEALWREEARPVRALYQGILQVGVGYYQVTRGNAQGAAKMLVRAARWLEPLPDTCQGVDVAQLRADAARVLAELRRLGAARVGEIDRALLKPVVYNDRSDPSRK
jgi:predicted metal-dependent hydrolase